jgi:hypothetical protein
VGDFVATKLNISRVYRDCQKNVPIEDRFSATNPYAAILFLEHYCDKRYKTLNFDVISIEII